MKVQSGHVVTMHYTLSDDSGRTIESTRGSDPLDYLHGVGQIIPGLEKALDGSAVGRKASLTVPPDQAYGTHDASAMVRVPLDELPADLEVAPGVEVQAETPDGPLTFRVVSIEGSEAVLDGNHPLAGKTLTFDVEILAVRAATPDELRHGHAHGPGGAHGHHHH